MKSKILKITAIGITTLFLSAQTLAWAGADNDQALSKPDRGTSAMSSNQGSLPDRNMDQQNQGNYSGGQKQSDRSMKQQGQNKDGSNDEEGEYDHNHEREETDPTE